MENYVWYASYGSNINQDRFHAYIFGEIRREEAVSEIGCRDQSLPLRAENVMIDFPMFFAKQSKRWTIKESVSLIRHRIRIGRLMDGCI